MEIKIFKLRFFISGYVKNAIFLIQHCGKSKFYFKSFTLFHNFVILYAQLENNRYLGEYSYERTQTRFNFDRTSPIFVIG